MKIDLIIAKKISQVKVVENGFRGNWNTSNIETYKQFGFIFSFLRVL